MNVVPENSISCFIGRICEEPTASFADDGILWVDFYDLDTSEDAQHDGPAHGEDGTTQRKALASWTLRSAFIAWNTPPKLTFHGTMTLKGSLKAKGNIKGKGKIALNNAILSNVSLAGGPPLQGPCVTPIGPGNATIPLAISSASGSAKIEAIGPNGEIEFNTKDAEIEIEDNDAEFFVHTGDDGTEDDKLDIAMTSQCGGQIPWCVASEDAEEAADIDPENPFIKEGDLALCMAFGNSLNNLYVVDIFRT